MAFKYQPDHNKDPWAEAIFKQINEAYQVLGNPSSRTAYDAERRARAQRAEEAQRATRERQHYRRSSGGRGSGYEGGGAHSSGINICPFCGQPNYQDNRFCSNCGRLSGSAGVSRGAMGATTQYHVHRAMRDYLGGAIFTTLLCFWPAGIVSDVFAARVNGKIRNGDIQGALRCTRNASDPCRVYPLGWGSRFSRSPH